MTWLFPASAKIIRRDTEWKLFNSNRTFYTLVSAWKKGESPNTEKPDQLVEKRKDNEEKSKKQKRIKSVRLIDFFKKRQKAKKALENEIKFKRAKLQKKRQEETTKIIENLTESEADKRKTK